MASDKKQLVKSIVFATIGGLIVGAIACKVYETWLGVIIMSAFGALVGFAFSRPSVSAARVLRHTAGSIVASNVPLGVRGMVYDRMTSEKTAEDSHPAESDTVSPQPPPPNLPK